MKLHSVISYLISIIIILTLGSCTERELDVLPVLEVLAVESQDITQSSAKLKADVIIVGNQTIVEYGIELSKSPLFSQSSTLSIPGIPPLGVFELTFTGLEANTKYYYKAYALINTTRVYSGTYENFTTKQ
jgi:hypothetical protein